MKARTLGEELEFRYREALAHPLTAILRLRSERVLVTMPMGLSRKQVTKDKRTGLFLPQQDDDRYTREWGELCAVLKVGEGCDPAIAPGVHVIIPMYAGTQIVAGGNVHDLCIIGDGDIMGVVEEL